MNLIKTPSFELAVYARGDEHADKLALVLPGRLDTKDYIHMTSHVDFLAKLGFYAVSFDPPGTWGSSGSIEDYTMTNYLKAINELIEHFGNKATLVMGHSRGGSMAMLAAITNPHISHLISIFSRPGPSDIGMQEAKTIGFETDYRYLPPGADRSGGKMEFKLPYSFFVDGAQYDMRDGLKRCTIPKLFIVGLHDKSVKPEVAREAYDVSAKPKILLELDSDHNYRLHSEITEKVNHAVGEFLETE